MRAPDVALTLTRCSGEAPATKLPPTNRLVPSVASAFTEVTVVAPRLGTKLVSSLPLARQKAASLFRAVGAPFGATAAVNSPPT